MEFNACRFLEELYDETINRPAKTEASLDTKNANRPTNAIPGRQDAPAERGSSPTEPRTGDSDKRVSFDRLFQSTLERVNQSCPHDWMPAEADWRHIDEVEARIIRVRRQNDLDAFTAGIQDYERAARAAFSRANT